MDVERELQTALEHIETQRNELGVVKAQNMHHERQRAIDSQLIEELEQELKQPRVEIESGCTVIRLTRVQHEALIGQTNTDLEVKLRGVEHDLEVAQEYNKQLQAQIEALTPIDDGQEPTYGELAAALTLAETFNTAAETARTVLEAANDELMTDKRADERTIKRLLNEVKGLRNDVKDLEPSKVA